MNVNVRVRAQLFLEVYRLLVYTTVSQIPLSAVLLILIVVSRPSIVPLGVRDPILGTAVVISRVCVPFNTRSSSLSAIHMFQFRFNLDQMGIQSQSNSLRVTTVFSSAIYIDSDRGWVSLLTVYSRRDAI